MFRAEDLISGGILWYIFIFLLRYFGTLRSYHTCWFESETLRWKEHIALLYLLLVVGFPAIIVAMKKISFSLWIYAICVVVGGAILGILYTHLAERYNYEVFGKFPPLKPIPSSLRNFVKWLKGKPISRLWEKQTQELQLCSTTIVFLINVLSLYIALYAEETHWRIISILTMFLFTSLGALIDGFSEKIPYITVTLDKIEQKGYLYKITSQWVILRPAGETVIKFIPANEIQILSIEEYVEPHVKVTKNEP